MTALRRVCIFLLCATLFGTTGRLAHAQAERDLTPAEALSAKISLVKFDAVPLSDVVTWFTDNLRTNVSVDWGALREAGIARETPITLKLSWVTGDRLLRLILQDAGGQDKITFYTAGNVLTITSREQADKRLFTRSYQVDDLVLSLHAKVNLSTQNLLGNMSTGSASGAGSTTGGGQSSSNLFGGNSSSNSSNTEDNDPKEDGKKMIEMIKALTPPGTWEEDGGRSKVIYFRGHLIITAPRSVHELFGKFIDG